MIPFCQPANLVLRVFYEYKLKDAELKISKNE